MPASHETLEAARRIRISAFEHLYEQFPFMKTEALDRVLKKVEETALEQIQAQ